jgi:hypothetical protein
MKRAIKRVVRQNPATSTVVIAGVGTVAAVGLLWWLVEKNAAAATQAVVAPAPTSTPTTPAVTHVGGSSITLIPNQPQAVSTGSEIGDSITINLPAGANWTGQSTGPTVAPTPLSGSAPITWLYQGPGTVYWTWVDATGQPQSTQMSFYTLAVG